MPTSTFESPVTVELSAQENYDRSFAAIEKLALSSERRASESPAELAREIIDEDPQVEYNHALAVVLSLRSQ